jgi:hypothetical protein
MGRTKSKIGQNVTLAEEAAAALLEQKRETKPISAAGLKRVQRVHELKELMAPYLAEIEEHKGVIFKEMDKKGVNVLTRRGVEIVSRDEVTQENLDKKAFKAQFPEIAVQFIVEKVIFRVNWKNPFHG